VTQLPCRGPRLHFYLLPSAFRKEANRNTRFPFFINICLELMPWMAMDVIALVDPCFHGYDNIVHNIQEMDPDSPWPGEGISFTTLWCRHVRTTCPLWRFLLR
jgi:hypothetical protein